jgi:hypothetical protein
MANVVHSSSSKHRSFALTATMLVLAGCVTQGGLLGEGLRLTTHQDKPEVRVLKAVETKPSALIITPVAAKSTRPAWCDYLIEDTAAQTTIMRAPTVSGNMGDDGKANLHVGMSLLNFEKANVMEEAAEARCRRFMAESGLQKLIFLSPQGLTSAGFKAKAKVIFDRRKDIQHLRSQIEGVMNDGFVPREQATALMNIADQLLVEAGKAKSEADRRTTDLLGAKDQASLLGREMLRAEADIEDLNSRMRTIDSMDVSVSAGWSDDISQDNFAVNSSDFGGKVSFSLKLGALSEKRYQHEQNAKAAKLRAITEEGGSLWQVSVLRLAHERAIQGLVESSSKIDSALAETNRLLTAMKGVNVEELQAADFSAKLKLIQLKADKAAVTGSLAEIRENLQRLKTEG